MQWANGIFVYSSPPPEAVQLAEAMIPSLLGKSRPDPAGLPFPVEATRHPARTRPYLVGSVRICESRAKHAVSPMQAEACCDHSLRATRFV
jgi:hypothetical protein